MFALRRTVGRVKALTVLSGGAKAAAARDWLEAYEREAYEHIEGWLAPGALQLLGAVNDAQAGIGVRGGVMEIGVYHGRFFIAMNGLVTDPAIQSVAIDLFAAQHLNIDGSGRGDQEIFASNLERYDRHDGRNVVVMAADSTTLRSGDVLAKLNVRPRIVSIDGGHTPEHTISDIQLAQAVMDPQGIVFVDDILNLHWLGVVEGVVNYLNQRPTLWPVALGHNKLLMCPMSQHHVYFKRLPELVTFRKVVRFCSYDVLTV